MNKLLEPVRKHFKDDPVAKELLAKVTQWRRETLTPTSSLVQLKLQLHEATSRFVVFAPRPSEYLRLSDVYEVASRLRSASSDQQLVLWLEDWSAQCLGYAGGSADGIKAYYDLLLHGLRSIEPQLMEKVLVCWQGEAITSGPSDYWTSVINAGRQTSLEAVRAALPNEPLEGASQVVTAIMHIGDVLALSGGASATVLCCSSNSRSFHQFASDYLSRCGLQVPHISEMDLPKLRLQADGEGLEADNQVLITDSEMDINRKIKKAFCEPGNVDFCPPLRWIEVLLQNAGTFTVPRKPENGGDLLYTEPSPMLEDFRKEILHPGDLKPAVGRSLNEVVAVVRAGIKASDSLKKAQKKLEGIAKEIQKKKN